MTTSVSGTTDPVAWVRRVNSRWIVHGGLDTSASRYLDHLAVEDPGRLVRSCALAHRLVHALEDPAEDPKPWFYGGLFSLATGAEAKRFLSEHSFVLAVVDGAASEAALPASLTAAGPEVLRKIERLRSALAQATRRPEG